MALVMDSTQNDNHRPVYNAFILAIGTANPPHFILQEDYPDFYFKNTNNEHMVDLKEKFRRILKHYSSCGIISLLSRQNILETEVPNLGKEAALVAIREWGQPVSKITHVVFATSSGVMMPGADHALAKLLGLKPNVKCVMLYFQGGYAGGTALRVAKDLAENNHGARVLVVCVENMAMWFHGPNENRLDVIVGQATLSDGAAASIVGANLYVPEERPVFEIVSANQNIVPGSDGAVTAHFYEMGMSYFIKPIVTPLILDNLEAIMVETFKPLGISGWNSLFYSIHPGGRRIVDGITNNLGIKEENLIATRHVLSEYGNMESACVIFILDELRKRAKKENKATTGDGKEYGCLIVFGPGLTVETIVLRSVPIA